MTQMTPGQARVIDPILTNHYRGFGDPEFVAQALFPRVPVAQYGGNIIQFGKEAYRRYNSRRAPGTNTKRVQFGYSGDKYSIQPSALEAVVPRELMADASQVPGLDLATQALSSVRTIAARERECIAADLARDASAYDNDQKVALTGQNRWSGSTADPSKDVKAGIQVIRGRIGMRPNVVLLSATAFEACTEAAKIVDRTKYTGRDSITTEILARLWNVGRVEVGAGIVAQGADDAFVDIWGADVVIAYVGPANSSAATPGCGYTYTIGGHPLVEMPYWDNSAKSWIYGVSDDNVPVVASRDSMFLIQNAGAAPS